MPQGSVLCPLPFLIYINHMDEDIVSKFSNFADDSKVAKVVNDFEDAEILRDDIVRLQNWSRDWQVEFNSDKCKMMHIVKNSLHCEYTLNSTTLKPTESERFGCTSV